MNLQYAPKSAKANRRHRQSQVVNPPVVFGQFKHCIGGAEYTSQTEPYEHMSQTDGKCEYGAAVQTRAKSEE